MPRDPRIAPDGVRAELRRGLAWVEDGHGGDGLKPQTIREARALAGGAPMSRDKAVRMRAWLARHAVDSEGKGYRPGEPGYPSPGRVAWALWGGDPAVAWSDRVVNYYEDQSMEKRTYSAQQRREMAAAGEAMPDGSFPIRDEADLRAAMRSIGRASDPAAARAHIRRRAKRLGLTALLTDAFKKSAGYYDWREGMPFPWALLSDPPDLPIPCTPADLTPAMSAAMPEAMQTEWCARFNALASPVPEGAGMDDEAAFGLAGLLCAEMGGWVRRPDGSYARIEVADGDWSYEEDEGGDMEKAGRVLSAANRARLIAARDALAEVLAADMPAESTEKGAPVPVRLDIGILKSEERDGEQIATGYAYIARDADGTPVTDHSGDVVDIPSMKRAVQAAMKRGLKVRTNHEADAAAEFTGSMWVDHDVLKAIGATPGDTTPADGWLIQIRVDDPALWKRIKSGEMRAFSIGGKGRRVPLKD